MPGHICTKKTYLYMLHIIAFLLVASSIINPTFLIGFSLLSPCVTLCLLILQCDKISLFTVVLCIISPISRKIRIGRNIKIKVIMTISLELKVSRTGTTVIMIIRCKTNASNVFRILLLYGLMMTCTKDIATLVVMSTYCVIKKSDE